MLSTDQQMLGELCDYTCTLIKVEKRLDPTGLTTNDASATSQNLTTALCDLDLDL